MINKLKNFNYKEGEIAGDKVYLVTPKDMGVQWNEENKHFRSIIIRQSDGYVVSRGFNKFVNFSEQPDFEPWDINWKVDAIHKMDGCCDAKTLIMTEDGNKSIKEICETCYPGKILGFNHEDGYPQYADIIGYSVKTNNNDWYELTLEDDSIVRLTGNHKVFLPLLGCYRQVKDLNLGDEFLHIKD